MSRVHTLRGIHIAEAFFGRQVSSLRYIFALKLQINLFRLGKAQIKVLHDRTIWRGDTGGDEMQCHL